MNSKWAVKLGPVSLRLVRTVGSLRRSSQFESPKIKDNPNVGAQFGQREYQKPSSAAAAPKPTPNPPLKRRPQPPTNTSQSPRASAHSQVKCPCSKAKAKRPRFRVWHASQSEEQAPASIPVRPDVIQALVDKGIKLPPHLQAQYEAMKDGQPAASASPSPSTPKPSQKIWTSTEHAQVKCPLLQEDQPKWSNECDLKDAVSPPW